MGYALAGVIGGIVVIAVQIAFVLFSAPTWSPDE